MPERPARAEAQNRSTPTPIGETIPRPVITARRFISGSPFAESGPVSGTLEYDSRRRPGTKFRPPVAQ